MWTPAYVLSLSWEWALMVTCKCITPTYRMTVFLNFVFDNSVSNTKYSQNVFQMEIQNTMLQFYFKYKTHRCVLTTHCKYIRVFEIRHSTGYKELTTTILQILSLYLFYRRRTIATIDVTFVRTQKKNPASSTEIDRFRLSDSLKRRGIAISPTTLVVRIDHRTYVGRSLSLAFRFTSFRSCQSIALVLNAPAPTIHQITASPCQRHALYSSIQILPNIGQAEFFWFTAGCLARICGGYSAKRQRRILSAEIFPWSSWRQMK